MRFNVEDKVGLIGQIGNHFGNRNVSIQSIVQFDASDKGAEIIVITHEVNQGQLQEALLAINAIPEVKRQEAHLGCL